MSADDGDGGARGGRPFTRVLVANRGEIACRVFRTARRMGLGTVAVYSEADRDARHVTMADEALALGGLTPAESYLDGERVIAAARCAGAAAIHPGYGFLSENADFAEACAAAGIVFVGPPPAAIRAMGLKDAAKRLMERAGVPVVPGYHEEAQDEATLARAADAIGYPVLVKARAGGGGKGMRRVGRAEDFAAALAAARREAEAAFGDGRVLLERWIEAPRHVEVQVFADRDGRVVHLFERDCSLQRRHQKVIEEAPAPGMTAAVREAMTGAAIRAAEAIGYVGAGTVEFIADAREGLAADRFYFMEMNTRLQVEHPVTEAVTGLDLVEWQLRVAAGEPLPRAQEVIGLSGHAVEARLYAEDVAAGFLPATGRLERLVFPVDVATEASVPGDPGTVLRVDSGVVEGDRVTPYYDPMIAKLVARGATRTEALGRLARLLADTVVLGTVTNRELLLALCRHPDVVAGRLDTALVERELGALLGSDGSGPSGTRAARALVAVLRVAVPPATAAEEPSLAARLGQWQLWGEPRRQVAFAAEHAAAAPADGAAATTTTTTTAAAVLEVTREEARRWTVRDADGAFALALEPAELLGAGGAVTIDGTRLRACARLGADGAELRLGERLHRLAWPRPGGAAAAATAATRLVAPMPGRVVDIACAPGERVRAGGRLLVLEAMKMEHVLVAPADAVVEAVRVASGAQVEQGAELLRFADESAEREP